MALDGNAVGGLLSELFACEMTVAQLTCGGCGAVSEIGAMPDYGGAMGAVLRCAHCDTAVLRLTHTPAGLWLDMQGTRRLFVAASGVTAAVTPLQGSRATIGTPWQVAVAIESSTGNRENPGRTLKLGVQTHDPRPVDCDLHHLHVIITLIAIVSGIIVVFGMLGAHRMPGLTALFLLTTMLTSVTGFLFPIHGFTPALGVGVISCILLVVALIALYGKHLVGAWRWIYVVTAVAALWFNVFVLIVQSFEKLSFLNAQAPQVGPPFAEPVNTHFAIAQVVALVVLALLAIIAVIKFHPAAA